MKLSLDNRQQMDSSDQLVLKTEVLSSKISQGCGYMKYENWNRFEFLVSDDVWPHRMASSK